MLAPKDCSSHVTTGPNPCINNEGNSRAVNARILYLIDIGSLPLHFMPTGLFIAYTQSCLGPGRENVNIPFD